MENYLFQHVTFGGFPAESPFPSVVQANVDTKVFNFVPLGSRVKIVDFIQKWQYVIKVRVEYVQIRVEYIQKFLI